MSYLFAEVSLESCFLQNVHVLNSNSFPFIFGGIISPSRQWILMTGEGKAASTGMPGKIKVMFQIFPPRAMGHTSSSSPNIPVQVIYEGRWRNSPGKVWEKLCWWAPGKDPQVASKSSLRFHLFQEVLCDFTQLKVALFLKPTLCNSCASHPLSSRLSPTKTWEVAGGG